MRGERSWYDTNEKRLRRVQLIDFETPARSTFHVTREMEAQARATVPT
jgi:type I site-specific restriction-modification system R (restriction) subunit